MDLYLVMQNFFQTDKTLKSTNFHKTKALYILKGEGDSKVANNVCAYESNNQTLLLCCCD